MPPRKQPCANRRKQPKVPRRKKTKVPPAVQSMESSSCPKNKTRRDNDSSSSKNKRFKASPSQLEKLTDIGIYCPASPITPSELLEKLQARNGGLVQMPGFIWWFIECSKEMFTFSIKDVNWDKSRDQQNLTEERIVLKQIAESQRKLTEFFDAHIESQDENKASVLHDRLVKRLFNRWYEHCFDFLNEIKIMLTKLSNPLPDLHGRILHGSDFRQLFLRYVNMFFLASEVSDMKKKSITIRNKTFGIFPKIRFCESNYGGSFSRSPLLLMLIEVWRDGLKKRDLDDEKAEGTWLESHFKSEVLGQIAMQMVSASKNSSFSPHALGIVCSRTEVILLYLELKQDQYDLLMKKQDLQGVTSCLQYTKSYDIMIEEDRDQLVEVLFWLACAQKDSFENFFYPAG